MGNVASGVAWRRVFQQRPEILYLFQVGNEKELEDAKRKHPRLSMAIDKFGMPSQSVLEEFYNSNNNNSGVRSYGGFGRRKYGPSCHMLADCKLSLQQHQQFFSDGYTIVEGGVPEELCDEALRHINAAMGRGEATSTLQDGGGGLVNLGSGEGGSARSPALLNLLDSSKGSKVSTVIQCLMGRNQAVLPPWGCQVALKFPNDNVPLPKHQQKVATNSMAWHVDGFHLGEHSPFTLLVGVCLADQAQRMSGELAVHPGAHWSLQAQVKSDYASLIGEHKPDLGPAQHVLLKKGDVVLCHQKLPHRGCPNYSPNIRYQIYFRIKHVRLQEHKEQWLDDLMLPFEGVRDIISSQNG